MGIKFFLVMALLPITTVTHAVSAGNLFTIPASAASNPGEATSLPVTGAPNSKEVSPQPASSAEVHAVRAQQSTANRYRYYAVKSSLPYSCVCITKAGKTTLSPVDDFRMIDDAENNGFDCAIYAETESEPSYHRYSAIGLGARREAAPLVWARDMIIIVRVPASRGFEYKIFLVPARYFKYSLHLKKLRADGTLAVGIDDYTVTCEPLPSGGLRKTLCYVNSKPKRRTIALRDQTAPVATAHMLIFNNTDTNLEIETIETWGGCQQPPVRIPLCAHSFIIIPRTLYRFDFLSLYDQLGTRLDIHPPFFVAPDYADDYREQVIVIEQEAASLASATATNPRLHYSTHLLRTFAGSLDYVTLLGCGKLIRRV
jgi:hypothetical protein